MDYRLESLLIAFFVSTIIFFSGLQENSKTDIEYLNQKKFAVTRCLYKVLEFDTESIRNEGSSGMYVQNSNDPIENFEKIDEYVNEIFDSGDFYYKSKNDNSLKLGRCIDFIDNKDFGLFIYEINN